MSSLNLVQIIGRLGADPESKTFDNGNTVVNLSVATSESWKTKDGEKKEKTHWHKVTIWNEHIGKIASQYLRKGSQVYLSGQIENRKYQAEDGSDRYITEIVVPRFKGELVLLDKKADGEQSAHYAAKADGYQSQPPAAELDDEIPFVLLLPALGISSFALSHLSEILSHAQGFIG